mmetsp:Transcript_44989/g.104101  ORF Transcript_44989/g.104101 Transcript_44989/m.104101 type:complete len:2344 (-) Transcript_44989:201-7232(-)
MAVNPMVAMTAMSMASQAGALGGSKAGGFNPMDPLAACRAKPSEEEEDEEEDEQPMAPPEEVMKYMLRMVIYSAENLPKDTPYVVVIIGEGTDQEYRIQTPVVQPETEEPTWEYYFEREVEVERTAPNVELQVWGQRMLADRQLGAAVLHLPNKETDGPKRSQLTLKNVPGPLFSSTPPPAAKLNVVWQLCESTTFQPDLERVAEKDPGDLVKHPFTIDVQVRELKMKHAKSKPVNIAVGFSLYRLGAPEAPLQQARMSPVVSTGPPKDGRGGSKMCNTAHFGPWRMPSWKVQESAVGLLTYVLMVRVFLCKGPSEQAKKGGEDEEDVADVQREEIACWKETVGDIYDKIDQRNVALLFDAELTKTQGPSIGTLRLTVDVYSGQPHKDISARLPPRPRTGLESGMPSPVNDPGASQMVPMASVTAVGRYSSDAQGGHPVVKKPQVPLLKSMPREAAWEQAVTYFCALHATNIQFKEKEEFNPFIRITMGPAKAETKRNEMKGRTHSLAWEEALKVTTKAGDRKAKVQLYHARPGWFGSDQLLGEAMVFDVARDKTVWLHLYGGAPDAPNADQAMSMVKGSLAPPSTFVGTVVVQFGSKRSVGKKWHTHVLTEYATRARRLQVRLYRGIYLDQFKNQMVHLLVQTSGCTLPDERAAAVKTQGHHSKAQIEEIKEEKAKFGNPNVLSFPGYVNKEGILEFLDEDAPGHSGAAGCFAITPSRPRSFEDMTCCWVERTTPAREDCVLNVPPGTTHAYVYIVADGKEQDPPSVFGRIRLTPPDDTSVAWKRLRYDLSVCSAPKSEFATTTAGMILGRAHLLLADSDNLKTIQDAAPAIQTAIVPRRTKESSLLGMCKSEALLHVGALGDVTSEATSATKEMYCHIDVLAARNVPATDEDGLCNPVYQMQVQEKLVDYPTSVEIPQTLNPNYMHRFVVKVDVKYDPTPGVSDLPLPPVLFRLQDDDADETGILSLRTKPRESISHIVIKNIPELKLEPGKSALDLNSKHQANWYALDRSATTPFSAKDGGVDDTWATRPAVLLSIAYSETSKAEGVDAGGTGLSDGEPNQAAQATLLRTKEQAHFDFQIDLLGLRNLPAFPLASSMELGLHSYWPGGGAKLHVERDSNVTFLADDTTDAEAMGKYQQLSEKVSKVYKLMLPNPDDDEQQTNQPALAGIADEDEDDDDDGASDVGGKDGAIDMEDLQGVSIKPPPYTVPVIPYLQDKEKSSPEEGPFVLMPSLTMQLQDRLTGRDFGTLSISTREVAEHAGGFGAAVQPYTRLDIIDKEHGKWTKEMEGFETELKKLSKDVMPDTLQVLSGMSLDERAYESFVDVFAARDGELLWDSDFRQGRTINEQHLFTIAEKGTFERQKQREDAGEDDNDDDDDDAKRTIQFFNFGDYLCTSPEFRDEPFDERCVPTLVCQGLGEGKEKKVPTGPSKLFEKALRANLQKKPERLQPGETDLKVPKTAADLQSMPTRKMKRAFEVSGWRAPTHLAPPVPEEPGMNADPTLEENIMHTFLRPVGHVIHKGDRDSRLLCRLKIDLPASQKEEAAKWKQWQEALSANAGKPLTPQTKSTLKSQEEIDFAKSKLERSRQQLNFLWIKFVRDGIVVWRTSDPADLCRPGAIIMAVKIMNEPDIIPVAVPSFDIRFPFESAWFCRKTLAATWKHPEAQARLYKIQKEMQADKRAKKDAEKKGGGMKADGKSAASEDAEARKEARSGAVQSHDEVARHEKYLASVPDGYSKPIPVAKNAFVCRIRKRQGTINFDRPQTRTWYKETLGNVFPEVKSSIEAFKEHHSMEQLRFKDVFLGRFLNLRLPLASGKGDSNQRTNTLVKGHVSCKRLSAAEAEERKKMDQKEVIVGGRSMELLWKSEMVSVTLYVLTVNELNLGVTGLTAGNFEPYIIAKIPGGSYPPRQTDVIKNKTADGEEAAIYKTFTFVVPFPGLHNLHVELWDKGYVRDTLVGVAEVEIEDRWMCLSRREMRMSSSVEFLQNHLCPLKKTKFPKEIQGAQDQGNRKPWIEPTEPAAGPKGTPNAIKIEPRVAPPDPLPIEVVPLMKLDEDTATKTRTGTMRLWVDMLEAGAPYNEADLNVPLHEFEVRVLVKDVTNIQIFKDFGERNDVFVKGILESRDLLGGEMHQHHNTDTHKWAHNEAHFNWRWKFNLRAPSPFTNLRLSLMDSDSFSGADSIYHEKVLSLDHLIRLNSERYRAGQPPVGPIPYTVVFDSWPKSKPIFSGGPIGRCINALLMCSCFQKQKRDQEKYARLQLEIQMVPKEMAATEDVPAGQISMPQGRVSWSTFLRSPGKFIKIVLGPANTRRLMVVTGVCMFVLSLLLIFVCIFYAMEVFGVN